MKSSCYLLLLLPAIFLVTGLTKPLNAYALEGQKWSNGNIVMHLSLGNSTTGLLDGAASWDVVAENALADWNPYLVNVKFQYSISNTVAISGDGVNTVYWDYTVFGDSFGTNVLAVTSRLFNGTVMKEADVTVNLDDDWNSYRGKLKISGANSKEYLEDLRRVLDHEFGHVLGLNHPDQAGQNVSAIMNSITSDLDHIVTDDINGVESLYGTPSTSNPTNPTTTDPFSGSAISGGWFTSAWFGTYNLTFYPWIYRTDLGFIYVDLSGSDLYLYVLNGNMGWLYTNASLYPFVYDFNKNTWMFYEGGTSFYNYALPGFETY